MHENRDNAYTVNDIEHGRTYGFVTTFMPNAKLSFNLGYTYTDIYTQAEICYYQNASGPAPATPCPASLLLSCSALPASTLICAARRLL